MTLAEISQCLGCEVLVGAEALQNRVTTVVAADGMSAVLTALCRRALLVTGLSNIQSVRTAHVADAAAIVYVRGVHPNEKTLELARQKNIVVLATRYGMFDTCGILRNQGLGGAI